MVFNKVGYDWHNNNFDTPISCLKGQRPYLYNYLPTACSLSLYTREIHVHLSRELTDYEQCQNPNTQKSSIFIIHHPHRCYRWNSIVYPLHFFIDQRPCPRIPLRKQCFSLPGPSHCEDCLFW